LTEDPKPGEQKHKTQETDVAKPPQNAAQRGLECKTNTRKDIAGSLREKDKKGEKSSKKCLAALEGRYNSEQWVVKQMVNEGRARNKTRQHPTANFPSETFPPEPLRGEEHWKKEEEMKTRRV